MPTGIYQRTADMYASRRGRKLSVEHRAKIAASVSAAKKGVSLSTAHRAALSLAHQGRAPWNARFTLVVGHTSRHRSAFKKLHSRAKRLDLTVDPMFASSTAGYGNFIAYVGPVPSNMRRPTVGRYDHSRGYVAGNFRWQEHSENAAEAATRNKKGVPLSPAHVANLKAAWVRRKSAVRSTTDKTFKEAQ